MPSVAPRSFTTFPALVLLAACGPSTPEAVRPLPDSSTPAPVASAPEAPVTPAAGLVLSQDVCQADADCVPATCCHPSACVSADKARSCNGILCTQECQPGTMDCGGSCLCHKGRCAARLGTGGR
jgi:hypothetical protein